MSTSYSLIVPVHLRALVVPKSMIKGLSVANQKAEFENLWVKDGGKTTAFMSDVAFPDSNNAKTLPPGAHLHWLLPPAFRHANISKEGGTKYPAAPNRWLVNRICYASNGTPSLTSWVVESDTLTDPNDIPGELQTTIAKADSTKTYQCQSLGKNQVLKTWKETHPAALANFSAVGYGEQDFAAFYQKSSSVFGLYDDFSALPAGTKKISYSVTGWFSDPTNDPVQSGRNLTTSWWWDYDLPSGASLSNSLYQGNLTGISPNKTAPSITKADVSEVVIANTYAEAMSTLMASKQNGTKVPKAQMETLLNAFQLGMANELGTASGLKSIGEAQHSAAFQKINGQTLYSVRRKDKKQETSLSKDISDQLNTLNNTVLKEGKCIQQLKALTKQIFADWQKFQIDVYAATGKSPMDGVAEISILKFIKKSLTSGDFSPMTYQDINAQLKKYQSPIDRIYGIPFLANKLKKSLETTNFELVEVAGPRYYEANPPVVLFNGPDANLPSFYKAPQGKPEKALNCRLSSDIVNQLAIKRSTVKSKNLTAKLKLPTGVSSLTAYLKVCGNAVLANLLLESLLLDTNAASFLAANLQPKPSDGPTAKKSIQAAQKKFINGGSPKKVTFKGIAPLFFNAWKQPWEPIGINWKISLKSPLAKKDNTAFGSSLIANNYTIDKDQLELSLKANPAPLLTETYQGFSIFTPKTYQNLKQVINTYLKFNPNSSSKQALGKLAQKWGGLQISAQKLDGFNEALLQKHRFLQLEVADPGSMNGKAPPSFIMNYPVEVKKIKTAVGNNATEGILPENHFSPLRGGYLKVTDLEIIDSFGQTRSVGTSKIKYAQSLTSYSEKLPTGEKAVLPPRITQASRLLFRWLSAIDKGKGIESNGVPETSPISGWLLPNFLDQSIQFYQADGTPIGTIDVTGNLIAIPGSNTDPGIKPIISSLNGNLGSVIKFFNGHSDRVADTLKALSETVVLPSSSKTDDSMAILTAHPLAIVQAAVQLDLQEMPAVNQSWEAFKTDMTTFNDAGNGPNFSKRSQDTNLGQVQFPVQLGKLESIDDGLMAYFKGGSYTTLYALGSNNTSGSVMKPSWNTISVTPDPDAEPSTLTMLMDVRAGIHATTGILPVECIDIPSVYYQAALQKMKLSLLTAPILVPFSKTNSFQVPLPSELESDWSWVSVENKKWSESIAAKNLGDAPVFEGKNPKIQEGWLQNSMKDK